MTQTEITQSESRNHLVTVTATINRLLEFNLELLKRDPEQEVDPSTHGQLIGLLEAMADWRDYDHLRPARFMLAAVEPLVESGFCLNRTLQLTVDAVVALAHRGQSLLHDRYTARLSTKH